MSDDQFTKLFVYMQKEFVKIHKKLDQKADKARVDAIYTMIDVCLKRLETNEHEQIFASHQVNRHEDWIKQLASNTKTRLVPER